MVKKRSTKRKTKTISHAPSVNVNVKANSGRKRIITIAIILAVIVLFSFFAFKPIHFLGSVFQNWFGPDAELINVDAFDGVDVNANGGLTKEEIKQETSESACPVHSDMNDNLYLINYDDIVCFYKKLTDTDGNTYYPNIVFVKTSDGLKYNGALNMIGHVVYSGWVWDMARDVTIKQDMSKTPSYHYEGGWVEWAGNSATSLCLLDSSSTAFYDYEVRGEMFLAVKAQINVTSTECAEFVLNQARDYLSANVVNPYFLKFCNNQVEIIEDAENPYADFNAFYDYIYRTAATHGLSKCVVDVTDLTCYPIPNDKKNTYPKADGGYYSVYKCNTMITCYYQKLNESTIYSGNKSIADGVKDDAIAVVSTPINPLYTTSINLTPKSWTKLVNKAEVLQSALLNNPVSINFYDAGNVLYRTLIFDSSNFIPLTLTATVNTGFSRGNYTYSITSPDLIFDSYTGAISITGNSTTNIKYDYNDGMVVTSFKIVPAANVDYSEVDFEANPTKIQLKSTDNKYTYTYTFDSADKVNVDLSQAVKSNDYNVTILSDALEFATTTKTITVSNAKHNFEFQFAVKDSQVVIEHTLKTTYTSEYKNDTPNNYLLEYVFVDDSLDILHDYFNSDTIDYEYNFTANDEVIETPGSWGTFKASDTVPLTTITCSSPFTFDHYTNLKLTLTANGKSYLFNINCPKYLGYRSIVYIHVAYEE